MIITARALVVACALASPAAQAQQEVPGEAVERAKAALQQEATVKDFFYQPEVAIEWLVGVLDDGTPRWGYAQYVCEVLKENGAATDATDVRIIDIVKVANQGQSFREASLGSVNCGTYEHSMP